MGCTIKPENGDQFMKMMRGLLLVTMSLVATCPPRARGFRTPDREPQADFDEEVGSPKRVAAPGGLLSGPGGNGQGVSDVVVAEFRTDEFIIARGDM
jgi:hypothetical protein